MTADELIQVQRRVGISNAQLARLTGRSPTAVWKWRQGHAPVPYYVEQILSCMFGDSFDAVAHVGQRPKHPRS